MIRFASTLAALTCLTALAACTAAAPDPTDTSTAEIGTCSEVDEEQVEHACIHSFAGPFRDVTASASAPPDVSREHTAYRVTLAAAETDADASAPRNTDANADAGPAAPAASYGGAVSFLPEEDGDYVVYLSSAAAQVSATTARGRRTSFECSTSVETDLCSRLRQLKIAHLEAGQPVTIAFEAPEPTVLLVIEHMGDHDHDDHDHDDHDHDHDHAE